MCERHELERMSTVKWSSNDTRSINISRDTMGEKYHDTKPKYHGDRVKDASVA